MMDNMWIMRWRRNETAGDDEIVNLTVDVFDEVDDR